MANYKDLLNKNKDRLEQMDKPRKKIKRKGPKRPWQENLEKYKEDAPADRNSRKTSTESPEEIEVLDQINESIQLSNSQSNERDVAASSSNHSPTIDIEDSRIGDSEKTSDTSSTHSQHNTDTTPTQHKKRNDTNADTIPTQYSDSKQASSVGKELYRTDTEATQSGDDYEYNTDTKSKASESSRQHNADTNSSAVSDLNKSRARNTGTMPAQKADVDADTKATQDSELNKHNTGTKTEANESDNSPRLTQYIRHNANTGKIGVVYNTDTVSDTTQAHQQHHADTTQTQGRHINDTIPTPSSTQHQHNSLDNADTISNQLRILKGQKLKVFHYCYETTVAGSYKPFRISYDSLSIATGIPNGSIRTTTKRLKNEGLIYLEALGKGRGALLEIGVPDVACKMYTRNINSNTTPTQIKPIIPHNTDTAIDTNVSSSSSNLINNTNTNYEEKNELSGEWSEIITPESLKEINFGKTQLLQLKRVGGLSPDEVQESLDAFAYDLDAGKVKSFGSKLGFLMGILRKGNSYISEAYMSEMREAYERQKALREEKEQLEKQQMEERLSKKAKEEYEKLSDDQKKELVPENNLAKVNSQVHERMVLAKLVESMGQKGSGLGEI